MAFGTVYTVSDARAQLPALIASTREGETPVIGGHRKAEAVLMPARLLDVYELLLGAMARAEVHLMLQSGQLKRGDVIHPGDPVGKVIAYLWQFGQRAHLSMFVSDILAQLRVWDSDAPTPRLRFTDLLDGIPMALPNRFPDGDVGPLIDFLRQEVPRYFGGDTDEP